MPKSTVIKDIGVDAMILADKHTEVQEIVNSAEAGEIYIAHHVFKSFAALPLRKYTELLLKLWKQDSPLVANSALHADGELVKSVEKTHALCSRVAKASLLVEDELLKICSTNANVLIAQAMTKPESLQCGRQLCIDQACAQLGKDPLLRLADAFKRFVQSAS